MEREEAIEIIKNNWPDNGSTMLREALETIIPELKESEDERIRKALLNWFLQFKQNDMFNDDVSFKDILTWLKAQGKHTKFIEKQDDTKLKKYIEVALNVLVKLLESDKFQKDAREHLFDKGDNDLSGIYDIYAEEAVKYAKALYKHLNKF